MEGFGSVATDSLHKKGILVPKALHVNKGARKLRLGCGKVPFQLNLQPRNSIAGPVAFYKAGTISVLVGFWDYSVLVQAPSLCFA